MDKSLRLSLEESERLLVNASIGSDTQVGALLEDNQVLLGKYSNARQAITVAVKALGDMQIRHRRSRKVDRVEKLEYELATEAFGRLRDCLFEGQSNVGSYDTKTGWLLRYADRVNGALGAVQTLLS